MKQPEASSASSQSWSNNQESWRAELSRIEQGYWRHSPAGIPVPGFFSEHGLCMGALPKIVLAKFLKDSACLRYGTFALELMHRIQPILTQNQFNKIVKNIIKDDYDMVPARQLSEQFSLAWHAYASGCHSKSLRVWENSLGEQENVGSQSRRKVVPFELHRYPAGFHANMAAIRSMLAIR
jgi:hypothetical protein